MVSFPDRALPDHHHITVQLPQFILGRLKRIRRWVQMISFEAVVGNRDGERFVVFLLGRRDIFIS